MDTSEINIKMCKKAVEIQDQRKFWTRGDWVIEHYPEPHGDKISVETWEIYRAKDETWLPCQDQLQEMVLNGEITWNRLAWDFGDFFRRKPSYANLFYTAEQAWLAFVMSVNYDKTWNGEEWVKSTP